MISIIVLCENELSEKLLVNMCARTMSELLIVHGFIESCDKSLQQSADTTDAIIGITILVYVSSSFTDYV